MILTQLIESRADTFGLEMIVNREAVNECVQTGRYHQEVWK